MPELSQIIDPILHLDKYMVAIIDLFGLWTYVILFLVVFAETGLVVTPFLPGDSLLFVAGTLSGSGYMNITIVYFSLLAAAILGDTVNYWVGHYIGPQVFANKNSRFFKKEYLDKTHKFYEKHGGKTIILARFVPIIRTFAPFVAGVGKMHYETFLIYNVVGGFLWVTGFVLAGYYFGGLEIIEENFHYAVFGIIIVSVLPMLYEYIKHKREAKIAPAEDVSYQEVVKTLHKGHKHK